MNELPHVKLLNWRARPEQILRAWRGDQPLVALWSGGRCRWSRWTILAEPGESIRLDPAGATRGDLLGLIKSTVERGTDHTLRARLGLGDDAPPFLGGWIGFISYEAGRVIEPAAALETPLSDARGGHGWPLMVWQRCPSALAFDNQTGQWWWVSADGEQEPHVETPPRRRRDEPVETSNFKFEILGLESAMDRSRYMAAVARAIEYIHAGDVFQVNLTHRLSGAFRGSARGLFAAMMEKSRPWYGAYLEMSDVQRRAIVSASPELFLQIDGATRQVVTRPMKGTLRGGADPRLLRESAKDRAELAMITDLMRNDLGRVCEFGSVRVVQERAIERHGGEASYAETPRFREGSEGVWQGVATVQGRLREGIGTAELLGASFPGGSITGAPKIRAMQIIEELEQRGGARGPYTGCIGYVSRCGNAAFNIAIRTAAVSGRAAAGGLDQIESGVLDYGVGAGIVADSDPDKEWEETMAKAGAILGVNRGEHGNHGEEKKSTEYKAQSSNGPAQLGELRVLRGESSGASR